MNELRTTLNDQYSKLDDQKQTAESSFLESIGRLGANRLKMELLDDAKEKVASSNFDTMLILMAKYHACIHKRTQTIYML